MKSLYLITNELRLLVEDIQSQDGDILPEQFNALNITQADLQQKAVNYAFVIKELDSTNSIIDMEIERLQGLKKRNKSISEKMREKISSAMIEFDISKVETETMSLSFRPSEETVIDNEFLLTEEYLTPKPPVPNKTAIKKAIKEGKIVAGAHIEQKKNLQIK
jgi:Siphovirus Gp157